MMWLSAAEAALVSMISILVLRKTFYGHEISRRLLTQNCFPLMYDHIVLRMTQCFVQVLDILCATCGILTHGLVAQTGSAAGF